MPKAKKKSRDQFKEKLPEQLVGDLRSLEASDGWKFIAKQLHDKAKDTKELVRQTCTDQELRYNADHLLKERIAVLYICMNLPLDSLRILDVLLSNDENNRKPIVERLKEIDEKFAQELLRYIKL